MDEELLQSYLLLTMKFLHNKQQLKSDPQPFHHANLVINHFIQCKNMLNQTSQVHKALLNYYEQRWVLKDEVSIDDNDSMTFINQMRKQNEVNTNVCQFVVQLLVIGLNSLMSKDIDKKINKKIKHIYNHLKFILIFESQSPTDILKPFIEKQLKQIPSFQFYENLLKIFKQIDSFSIVTLLEKTISDFREQWDKNQQQIKDNFTHKKKNRQHALISSQKQILSLSKYPKHKENYTNKENNREAHKTAEKSQGQKTCLKSIKIVKQKPINQRQSFHHGKSYQFNPRVSTSSFESSQESLSFDEMKLNSHQTSRLTFYGGKRREKLEQIDEDCLCEGTPDKMKKVKKQS